MSNNPFTKKSPINEKNENPYVINTQSYTATKQNDSQNYRWSEYQNAKNDFLRLISLLIKQQKPNIVSYYLQFKQENQIIIVSEYYEKNNSLQVIKPENKQQACKDIALGLQQIHELRYQHASIQPCNVYYLDGKYKLAITPECLYIKVIQICSYFGNELYWPPEIVEQKANDVYDLDCDHTQDIFALACLMFYIYTGENLFTLKSDRSKIPDNQVRKLELIDENERQFIQDVIKDVGLDRQQRQKAFNNYLENLKQNKIKKCEKIDENKKQYTDQSFNNINVQATQNNNQSLLSTADFNNKIIGPTKVNNVQQQLQTSNQKDSEPNELLQQTYNPNVNKIKPKIIKEYEQQFSEFSKKNKEEKDQNKLISMFIRQEVENELNKKIID